MHTQLFEETIQLLPDHEAAQSRASFRRRGQAFLLARQALVKDDHCLEIMIMACITDGCLSRDALIKTVPKYVGHSYPHVAAVIDRCTGPDPDQHYWYRDEQKNYRLHPEGPVHGRCW